jgi:predicted amidohydrolase
MADKVVVAVAQVNPQLAKVADNLAMVEAWAERAADEGAQLVVFPECALTGYCFESRKEAIEVAEPADSKSAQRLAQLCASRNLWLVVGTLERDGDRLFNAALLIGPDGLHAVYRKVHLPCMGVDRFADAGDRPFQVHDTPVGRIGLHICYDAAFPEAARVMTLDGAEVLCLPTNWAEGARPIAEVIPRARALENRIYFVAANRIGEEGGFRFIGMSQIAAPSGAWLACSPEPVEALLVAELDLREARRKRLVHVPGRYEVDRIGDRRPDFYRRLVQG